MMECDVFTVKVIVGMAAAMGTGFWIGMAASWRRMKVGGRRPEAGGRRTTCGARSVEELDVVDVHDIELSPELCEEDVRRVEETCRASRETRECVAWLARSVERDAVRAMADGKADGAGYPFALARLSGMVAACAAVQDMWAAVLDGTMAEGMKEQREEREKKERSARRQ